MEIRAEQIAERTWQDIMRQIQVVLDYRLFEIDGQAVSVAKLLLGVLFLIFGYFLSRRAANFVDRRVMERMHVDSSLRFTFRRLIFYFFFFISTLFTLRALNVPITIFTVMGGALAVGIGFGSQNLVNNFISGILVMMERPIRVGDIIEVAGVTGTVINIGIRSTRLRAGNNSSVTIPNTSLIQGNLTNWTQHAHVGGSVRFGVAYDTDLELLKKICFESLDGVEGVLSHPPPSMVFQDFGDNALIFDVSYTIPSSRFGARKRIESDIRFKMNTLFNKNQISLPFPQRDIHLGVDLKKALLQSRE